ncbi:CMP-N-acetylneuraminic acid synthetase [Cricetibacter osteomyelitidis]|uniref:CMP-N-acetylneuraminic acid synthetase n=1 Tax=Cricetibacter osteomyelitidis TaxID=1521931 RepID=A0A4R2SYD6_9PAST|nr:GDSL-type esterase/lipase family protein [Cricetibacter osteomyelitidis]TCP95527.1 CMP-N-acetylneuraminic acid synthetase [Cricetibacter osteomyelitidis]
MKKIAIITARAGSKGLPNKNMLLVDGKPLMAYSIDAAIESNVFDKIIVTTDSQEYIDALSHYPIEFINRAPHLATDTASSFVALEDVLLKYADTEFDYFVQLQPTSPLRTVQHIKEACEKFEKNFDKFDFLVSVTDAHKPTTLTRKIDEDESLKYFQLDYSNYARQNYSPEYSPNGAFFLAKPKEYLAQKHFYGEKSLAYFMDKTVSVDIDDRTDFEHFYFLIQQRNKENILLNQIKQRILAKKENFNRQANITFVGHSILDQWNIEKLANLTVQNIAVSGISTRQYIELLLDSGIVKTLAKKVLLMTGTNDIVKPNWTNESVLSDIQELIQKLKNIRSDIEIYFLAVTPVAFRADRNNQDIRQLNTYLKTHLTEANWIDLDDEFSDQYHKLNLNYTNDGLHLNNNGYQLLENIVKSAVI